MDFKTLLALADRGVPEAKMLLATQRKQAQQQHASDTRWRNLCACIDKLKDEGKGPCTGQEFVEAFSRYGYVPNRPLSQSQLRQAMDFPTFSQACGGWGAKDDYPAKGGRTHRPCATMRCNWCGEWYCSKECLRKDMKDHLPTCRMAAENIHLGNPPSARPELWTAQQYARTFGLPQPPAAPKPAANTVAPAASESGGDMAGGSASGCGSGAGGLTKNQKKKAKKKEKKAAAATATAAAAQDATVEDQSPGGQHEVEMDAADAGISQLTLF